MVSKKALTEERKKKAWFLWLGGMSFREIGKELGVSHAQIEKDIKKIKTEWEKQNESEISEIAKKELIKLEQWESRITVTHNKTGTDKDTRQKVIQEINAKMRIQQRRLRLLGLDKVLIVNVNENYDMKQFSDDELERIIKDGVSPKQIIAERNFESNSGRISSSGTGIQEKTKSVKGIQGKGK